MMFGRLLGCYIMYTFSGALGFNGILPGVQNSFWASIQLLLESASVHTITLNASSIEPSMQFLGKLGALPQKRL